MQLDKLEIKGFKSFKDKTILEFPSKFTAIVGPNGAGKSNIVESICFVLGWNRGIRSNNMQDLICNGGLHADSSDVAVVSIYLNDGNGNKVKVSREIDREGKSIYRKDNKRTTKQELIELLGDNEYNIILQDDITKIIDMNPRDRRKIIDGLCGIGEYDKKKEKAIRELEKVEKRISNTQLILGEKQGYLNQVEKERNDALRYRRFTSDLKQYKGNILRILIERHRKKLKNIDKEIQDTGKEIEDRENSISAIRSDISKKNKELNEINSEILKFENEKGQGGIYELKSELLRMQDRIDGIEHDIRRIDIEISERDKKVNEFRREKKKITRDIEEFNKGLADLSKRIKKESRRVVDSKADSKLDGLKTKIFELQSKRDTILGLKDRYLGDISSLKKEVQELEDSMNGLLENEKILARNINEKLTQNKKNFDEFKKLREELPFILKKERAVENSLNSLKLDLAEKKTEIKTMERNSGGIMKSVDAVMKLKEILPGIHGTVSQLGSVSDSRYETALQIAAGGRMMNIVVDNEDTAGKCIKYLQEKRIGRATFLPLNRVRVIIKSKAPKGSIGFARDFIDTKKRFMPIFEYVFRDTILVNDLENARSMGIGKWRMVTLNGDLLELSGAMTGGYTKRTLPSFLNTENLENEIKDIEKRILEFDGEKQELELKRKKMEDRILELEAPVRSGRTDVERIKVEKDSIKGRIAEIKKKINEINDKIKNLKKDISMGDSEIKRIEENIRVYEKELRKIENGAQRDDISKLEEMRDKKRDIEIGKGKLLEREQLIEDQIRGIRDAISTLKKERGSLADEVKQRRNEVAGLEKELESKIKESNKITERVGKLMNRRAEIEEAITRLGESMGETEHQINAINERLNKARINKAKIETKLSDIEQEFRAYDDVKILDNSLREMEKHVADIEVQLEGFGAVNMRAIEAYDKMNEEFRDVSDKLNTLKEERQSIFEFMEKVEARKKEVFMETFNIIKGNFEEMYHDLSGGDGTLTLSNPRDISDSGLLISASPRGKRLVNMDSMSGGEKIVTCSAFLLAIQQYRPADFYIVDEFDAPLDKENSIRFAEMLKKSAAQFMVVTHNDYVIKHADSVIGVSMNDGLSQIVGVKLT